jgi:ABC-type xylose transport system permease subunit
VSSDRGSLLIHSVAAAVIGETSLFGGGGQIVHANGVACSSPRSTRGRGLLGLTAAQQYVVTAVVLVVDVALDVVACERNP